jgi:chromosome segregation and condensation protein ScpB
MRCAASTLAAIATQPATRAKVERLRNEALMADVVFMMPVPRKVINDR